MMPWGRYGRSSSIASICADDFNRHCAFHVEDTASHSQTLRCMQAHAEQLAPPCRARVDNATAAIDAFLATCAVDLAAVCPPPPDAANGSGAELDWTERRGCAIAHLPTLSAGCLATVSALLRHEQDRLGLNPAAQPASGPDQLAPPPPQPDTAEPVPPVDTTSGLYGRRPAAPAAVAGAAPAAAAGDAAAAADPTAAAAVDPTAAAAANLTAAAAANLPAAGTWAAAGGDAAAAAAEAAEDREERERERREEATEPAAAAAAGGDDGRGPGRGKAEGDGDSDGDSDGVPGAGPGTGPGAVDGGGLASQ
jgi:hypothetical protein